MVAFTHAFQWRAQGRARPHPQARGARPLHRVQSARELAFLRLCLLPVVGTVRQRRLVRPALSPRARAVQPAAPIQPLVLRLQVLLVLQRDEAVPVVRALAMPLPVPAPTHHAVGALAPPPHWHPTRRLPQALPVDSAQARVLPTSAALLQAPAFQSTYLTLAAWAAAPYQACQPARYPRRSSLAAGLAALLPLGLTTAAMAACLLTRL